MVSQPLNVFDLGLETVSIKYRNYYTTCMSNNSVAISCDLDDTLIPTHFLFEQAKDELTDFIQLHSEKQITNDTIINELERIDMNSHEDMGITKDRFALSMLQTTRLLLDEPAPEVQDRAFEIGMKPIKTVEEYQDIGVLDGYSQFCEKIITVSDHCELVTVGDIEVQSNKVAAFDLNEKFDRVSILESGNKDVALQRMIDNYDTVIHIGNSLQSDIKPADKLGITAIHVNNSDWLGDYEPTNPKSTIHTVDSLPEAKDKLDYIL